MRKIRILIADSHLLIREGIKSLLSKNKDLEIVSEVTESKEILPNIKKSQPDVVVIDFHLPGFFSIDDIANIHKEFPLTNVFVITTNQHKADILRVLQYGVNSYILKECDEDEVIKGIYATAKGEKFFCGKVLDVIMEKHFPKDQHCEPVNLSERETEIVKLLAEGLSNKLVADKLHLSIHTVNTHRKNIFRKLGIRNASELVLYAVKKGIINS